VPQNYLTSDNRHFKLGVFLAAKELRTSLPSMGTACVRKDEVMGAPLALFRHRGPALAQRCSLWVVHPIPTHSVLLLVAETLVVAHDRTATQEASVRARRRHAVVSARALASEAERDEKQEEVNFDWWDVPILNRNKPTRAILYRYYARALPTCLGCERT